MYLKLMLGVIKKFDKYLSNKRTNTSSYQLWSIKTARTFNINKNQQSVGNGIFFFPFFFFFHFIKLKTNVPTVLNPVHNQIKIMTTKPDVLFVSLLTGHALQNDAPHTQSSSALLPSTVRWNLVQNQINTTTTNFDVLFVSVHTGPALQNDIPHPILLGLVAQYSEVELQQVNKHIHCLSKTWRSNLSL